MERIFSQTSKWNTWYVDDENIDTVNYQKE